MGQVKSVSHVEERMNALFHSRDRSQNVFRLCTGCSCRENYLWLREVDFGKGIGIDDNLSQASLGRYLLMVLSKLLVLGQERS